MKRWETGNVDLMGQKRSGTEQAVHLLFLMITLAECGNGVGCCSVSDLESLALGWLMAGLFSENQL